MIVALRLVKDEGPALHLGTDERVDGLGRIPARRVDSDRGSARVVAVETESTAEIRLGVVREAVDEARLRARDRRGLCPRVLFDEGILDVEVERIHPEPDLRAEAWVPPRRERRVRAAGELDDFVFADGVQAHAVLRVVERDLGDEVVS